MVNEVALALLLGLFGWRIALLYMGLGLTVAILSGMVIGLLHLEACVEDCGAQHTSRRGTNDHERP
jgi:hypothetical protein